VFLLGSTKPNLHKTVWKNVCSDLLYYYEADGDSFASRIITGDETWIHHLEPWTKRHSLEWLHSNSAWKKKFKATHSAGKTMATVFWDAGVILEDIYPLVKPLTQICTVKLLKPSRNISGEFNLTKMLLKLSFSVTMHDYTQV